MLQHNREAAIALEIAKQEKDGFILETDKNEAFIEGRKYLKQCQEKIAAAENKLVMLGPNGMKMEFTGINLQSRFEEKCQRMGLQASSFRQLKNQ